MDAYGIQMMRIAFKNGSWAEKWILDRMEKANAGQWNVNDVLKMLAPGTELDRIAEVASFQNEIQAVSVSQ
ncbi:MAG: hypothetical protein HY619_01340 [Thaumarchaeota archaeon]|nr:hypothetical protein [Nitrososphaerota archaeon]